MATSKKKQPENHWVEWIKKMIESLVSEKVGVLAGVIVTLTAMIGFWVSPIKSAIYHIIWEEKVIVDMHISSGEKITLGSSISVEIDLISDSQVSISGGILRLLLPADSIEVIGNSKLAFETPVIEHRKLFPEGDKIVLKPKHVGRYKMIAQFKNTYSTYADTIILDVVPSTSASEDNFSGQWQAKIGALYGQLDIIENIGQKTGKKGPLNGSYSLGQFEQGIISGARDGHTFFIELLKKPNLNEKWDVEANWRKTPDGKYIEIKGKASLMRRKNDNWSAPMRVDSFYANTSIY
jgi:hypothetical protein